MKTVFDVLEQIEQTSSSNTKIDILSQNKNDEMIKKLLYLCYSPYLIYNVKKYPKVNPSQSNINKENYYKFIDLLDILNKRIVTGNAALDRVSKFFANCNTIEQKWYDRILKKDLRCNITSKSINKAIKNLIPTFNLMLASPYEDKIGNEIAIEVKLDGYRTAVPTDNLQLFSRNGKLIEGFLEIEQQLQEFKKCGLVLDGELMGESFASTQKLSFKKSKNKTGVNYYIFDGVKLEDFSKGKSSNTLIDRKNTLKSIYSDINPEFIPNIKLVDFRYVGESKNIDTINKIHKEIIADGYEGSMIKDLYSYYECKRTKSWLKLKDFDLHDLKVIDIYEGTGKYENMMGGVVVDYKGYNVEVGSGWNDHDRVVFWKNPELIIGKTIMVQAQEESEDKHGNISLRFPTFKSIRLDK